MAWLLYLYIVTSVVISFSAMANAGLAAGFYAITTSAVVLIAGGGLKAVLFSPDITQKVGGSIVAGLLALLAYWLSEGFSAGIFGHVVTGTAWAAVGFAIAFLWVGRATARRVLS